MSIKIQIKVRIFLDESILNLICIPLYVIEVFYSTRKKIVQ